MASISKYARNERRKQEVKAQLPNLLKLKNKLANSCKVSIFEKVIANIENKLKGDITNEQKETLHKELAIYKKKIADAVELTNKEKWNLQFEISKEGKALRRTAVRTRCNMSICSRPRGILHKKFGLCRLHMREFIGKGLLPGNISQRSW